MLERHREGVPPAERPTDADRDRLVALLRTQCADGLLTLDEFSDRVSLVLKARSTKELDAIATELGVPGPAVPDRSPKCTMVLGIMCGGVRRGRWRPGDKVKAVAFWGGVHLDFRAAEWSGPVVNVKAVAIMGGIDIVVPEGVRVEVEGTPIMGGVDRRVNDVPILPGTPVIKVKAVAFWGGVVVRSRPSRRKEARDASSDLGLEQMADAVAADPPALEEQTAPDGTVTVLFSDIEDFTVLTEKLGDLKAQELLRAHNELVRAQIAACGGREVKSQGDSFMVAFAGARRGVRCAIGIQRAIAEWSEKHPDQAIRVRIGLHTGEVIREENDLFGRSVILAARIADEADGDTVLVSSLLKELVESSGEFDFGPPRTVELKGLQGVHVLHPVLWH
ncbi:MAG TPA: adenylate/guanylate cyclase domain-containing protein [Acidimicrobiales bacterium]|nr:adenylate/guanylate cyclase domain-containing protein [Acidimicrobiales bacterium]